MSAVPAPEPVSAVLTPHWLPGPDRAELAALVRTELVDDDVHPVAAVLLADVLTELHVAAARDAVWPADTARVRMATGWSADVLPVRLSPAELASVLSLRSLPPGLRAVLAGGGAR